MKAYRADNGVWINLSLCTRFYLEQSTEGWWVAGAIDHLRDEEITFSLSDYYSTKEGAQEELDRIMQYADVAR